MQPYVRRRPFTRPGRAVAAVVLALLCGVPWAAPAQAHGTTIDPASRNFGCWQRWAGNWNDPALPATDPMCHQAWQDDPNSLLKWDGPRRYGPQGGIIGTLPDGQLCSGGSTANGRYEALDVPGPWHTTTITDPNDNFSLFVADTREEGADLIWILVTEQGYDATTDPLTWDDLELVRTEGSFPPEWGDPPADPRVPGVAYEVVASAPDRTGHHVVFTIWKSLDREEWHYSCSDVLFT